eukprot:g24761.t1
MVTGAAALEQFQEMKQMAPQLRSLRPSAALYSCGAVGVALRLRRSDATEVEPWLLLVEHVSTSYVDTASAALYLDANQILHDDAGEVAPDVAVLAMEPADFYKWFRTSEMYKSTWGCRVSRAAGRWVEGNAMGGLNDLVAAVFGLVLFQDQLWRLMGGCGDEPCATSARGSNCLVPFVLLALINALFDSLTLALSCADAQDQASSTLCSGCFFTFAAALFQLAGAWVAFQIYRARPQSSGYSLVPSGDAAPDPADARASAAPEAPLHATEEQKRRPVRLEGGYLAMVFTRNPLGQVPGQAYALPVILWVKTAELLISRAPKSSSQRDPSDAIPSEERGAFWRRWRQCPWGASFDVRQVSVGPVGKEDYFQINFSYARPDQEHPWNTVPAETVRQMTQSRGATSELAEALAGPDPSAALTEAEGQRSAVRVFSLSCLLLRTVGAAQLLGPAGAGVGEVQELAATLGRAFSAHSKTLQRGEEDDRAGWPKRLRRLALAMMAEEGGRRNDGRDGRAVSRACRRLVRSVCLSSNEAEGEVLKKLLWNALGLDQSSEGHSDECDVVIAQRKSALLFAPQGKYFQVALTNCTPQGVVGTLMLHMAMLQGTLDPSSDQAVELLMKQLWTREIFMKAFVEAVLPGEVSPGSVQAALYVQGLRYHSAKQRRGGLAPLSAPEQILHTLAREQRHLAYLERNRATEHGSLETERRTAPGALTTVDDTDVYSGSMLESHPNGSRKELFTRGSQEQLRAKLASQSSGARKAARSAKRHVELSTFAPAHAGLPRRFTPKEISDLNVCREASVAWSSLRGPAFLPTSVF